MQNTLLSRRVRLHAKRAGFILSERESVPEYPVDTLNTLSSLPEITFPHSYSLDALKNLDSMILSNLQLLQFGVIVQESKFLLTDLPGFGFAASVLYHLSTTLTYSYLYNRTLLVNDSKLLYDFCYEPIFACSFQEINKQYTKNDMRPVEFNCLPQEEKFVYFNRDKYRHNRFLEKNLNSANPLSLPMQALYLRGIILGSFLKLKQEYKTHIEEKRKAIGFKNPIIGVHIRQGDVLTEPKLQFRNFPIQTYLEVVRQLVDKTGITTVFVTTDSEEVIRQLPKNSGIDFIYADKEIRYNNRAAIMLRDHPELKKQETLASVKNIYLLSECDYIIGNSSWFYNSVSMHYFRNKKLNGIIIKKRNNADDCNVQFMLKTITNNNKP